MGAFIVNIHALFILPIVCLLGSRSLQVSGQCVEDWHQLGDTCYYVGTGETDATRKSWYDARSWCQRQGGDLAMVNTDGIRNLTYQLSHTQNHYSGSLWMGLSRVSDYQTWRWVDGTAISWSKWHPDQPSNDRTRHCAHQFLRQTNNCFDVTTGVSYNWALNDDDPKATNNDTIYLGSISGASPGCEECLEKCMENSECDAYTYYQSGAHPAWKYYCIGRSIYSSSKTEVAKEHVCGGKKITCKDDGDWFNDNCGIQRGFICEKPLIGNTAPPVLSSTTVAVGGYCPEQEFLGIGNKCFHVYEYDPDEVRNKVGYTWLEALDQCRKNRGLRADLASFHSEQEMAEVAMHLFGNRISFWIGLYKENQFGNWVWSDNSPVDFDKFKVEGTGTDECTQMGTIPGPIGSWEATHCEYKRGYICQAYKDPDVIVPHPFPTEPIVTCAEGQVSFWHSCYELITEKMKWADAETACISKGGHLASIRDGAENYAMLHYFSRYHYNLWLGLQKNSTGEWLWPDSWPTVYVNWGRSEPKQTHECAIHTYDGSWRSSRCGEYRYPLCKISQEPPPTHPPETEGECPSDDWIHYGGHCYYFSSSEDKLSWDAAETKCSDLAQGLSNAHQISIHSYLENKFMFDELRRTGPYDIAWIGLRQYNNVMRWSDDSAYQFEMFAPEEPKDDSMRMDCAYLNYHSDYTEGHWMTFFCNAKLRYVCKADKKVAVPTTPPQDGCPERSASYGPYCYNIVDTDSADYKGWAYSQDVCRKTGGYLAPLPDEALNKYISAFVAGHLTHPDEEIWIGLIAYRSFSDGWSWDDGSDFEYNNWDLDHPREDDGFDCGYLMPATGKWRSGVCHGQRGALCRTVRGATTTTRPTPVPKTTTTTTATTTTTSTTRPTTTSTTATTTTKTTSTTIRPTTSSKSSTTMSTTSPMPVSSTAPTEVEPPQHQKGGLSKDATIGVALGVIACVALIAIVGWFGYQKCRAPKHDDGAGVRSTSFTNPITFSNSTEGAVYISSTESVCSA